MKLIDQMAIENGADVGTWDKSGNGQLLFSFNKPQLEAFAKAYAKQKSEPFGFVRRYKRTLDANWSFSTDCSQIHSDLFPNIEYIKLYTQPPNTVSLEQYNKLLDKFEEVDIKAQSGLCYYDLNTVREFHKDIRRFCAQAIEEAERSDK